MSFLSASYVISILMSQPCVSEMDHRPDVQETVVYKCPFDPHKLPPMSKEQARVPPTVDKLMEAEAKQKNPYKKPTKKVSHRCGSKTPVWYTKNGSKRYRCK